MKKATIVGLLIIFFFSSCKKSSTLDFATSDAAKPAVPVTVSNLYAMTNGVPTVLTSLSGGGAITVTLQIPAGSGRTIKEITRVGIASTTTNYTKIESVQPITSTGGTYSSTPITGSGTTATFTTSIAEFTAKTGLAVTTSGTATSFLSRYFYFLVTLDNGEQVIAVPVRVYVNT